MKKRFFLSERQELAINIFTSIYGADAAAKVLVEFYKTGKLGTAMINAPRKHREGKVMTPEHPLWEKFVERLEGPEGCNFQKDENDRYTWKCKGGTDKSKATAILGTMPDINIEVSLQYFEQHGGHCDCEILFNVNR